MKTGDGSDILLPDCRLLQAQKGLGPRQEEVRMGEISARLRRVGTAPAVVRRLCGLSLIVLVAALGGCNPGSEKETPTPVKPLAMELRATILDYAWALGSEARVAFDGSTMLVPNGYRGISIYGLGDPAHPERLATVDRIALGGQGGATAAGGGRAFVATPDSGQIVELDISTPSSPKVGGRFGALPEYAQLVLRGSRLFVQSGSNVEHTGGVFVFDVSQSPPPLLGEYLAELIDPGFYASASGRVLQARTPAFENDVARIDMVDMSKPDAPLLISTWSSSRGLNVQDIDVQQGRAYCAAYWGGLLVLSGADGSQLKTEAEFDWSEEYSLAQSVAAAPPYVFVARGYSGGATGSFQAFRLDGNSLTPVWEQPTEFPVHSVAVFGNRLITVEQEPPYTDWPKKILKLYRIFAE
jgi:hypothetical protein